VSTDLLRIVFVNSVLDIYHNHPLDYYDVCVER